MEQSSSRVRERKEEISAIRLRAADESENWSTQEQLGGEERD